MILQTKFFTTTSYPDDEINDFLYSCHRFIEVIDVKLSAVADQEGLVREYTALLIYRDLDLEAEEADRG